MKSSVEDLVKRVKLANNKKDNIELFNETIESFKYSSIFSQKDGAIKLIFKLFIGFWLLSLVSFLELGEYFWVFMAEFFTYMLIISIAIKFAQDKKYYLQLDEEFLLLLAEIKSNSLMWHDFKSYLVTENEICLNKNPVYYRNVDKFVYLTLTPYIFKFYFTPVSAFMKYLSMQQYQWLVAMFLFIPFIRYAVASSNFSRLDRIKSLLKLVSKFDGK